MKVLGNLVCLFVYSILSSGYNAHDKVPFKGKDSRTKYHENNSEVMNL